MTIFTVQCEYPALFRTTITVDAADAASAAMQAIEDSNLADGWKSLDWPQPTYVVALAQGEDAEPWTRDDDGFEMSVIPVPLLTSRGTRLNGYTATRADDLLSVLTALTAALDVHDEGIRCGEVIEIIRNNAAGLIDEIARVGQPAPTATEAQFPIPERQCQQSGNLPIVPPGTTPTQSVRSAWKMACPACGADDGLSVDAIVSVRLTGEGTHDAGGDHEWSEGSGCCCSCGWSGHAGDAEASALPENA